MQVLPNQTKVRAIENFIFVNKNLQIKFGKSLIHLVKWQSLRDDWFALNTYGSTTTNPGFARAGGIIRNHFGF